MNAHKKHVVVLPPCLLLPIPHDILQKWIIKKELTSKDGSKTKKWKVLTLEVKQEHHLKSQPWEY